MPDGTLQTVGPRAVIRFARRLPEPPHVVWHAARNAAGWEVCLELLAGRHPAADAWKLGFDRYVAEFEPELGPQEGPPPGFEPE